MNNRWLLYLLLASLAYLAVLTSLGRFPNIDGDEIWYKAAGREWAATGHFAAPELHGVYGFDPPLEKVWFPYPPLYPFLFGCLVRVFGFGWRQCVAFDALIHSCLALLTYEVARVLSPGADRRAAFWAGLAVVPMGVMGRPDELAICFGMAGLLPLLRPMADAGRTLSLSSAVASGALFGLCAGTSCAAATVLGLVAMVFLVAHGGSRARVVILGGAWAGTAAITLAAEVAPILLKYPDAYKQYLDMTRIIFRVDSRSHWEKITALLTIGRRASLPVFGMLALGLTTLANSRHRGTLRRWMVLWLGPLGGAMFLLVVDPHLYCYVWFLGPYVLAAIAVTLTDTRLAPVRLAAHASRGVVVLLALFGSIETAKQTIILATLPATQSMEYHARWLRDLIPPGSTVTASGAWWLLASDYKIYDVNYISTKLLSEVDYIIADDSLPPHGLDDYVREHFRLIHDCRRRGPYAVLGVPLSRSYTGFGTLVFARR